MTMGFRRFKSPINSTKNIVDATNLAVAAGVTTDIRLATAENDYTGSVSGCTTGSTINGFYLFCQIISATTGTSNMDWYVWKGPAAIEAVMPVPGATGGHPNRKYILHEEKGIPGNASDGAYPLTWKGVVVIPKGRRRMAEDDIIELRVRGADIYNQCSKAIYKFYR